MPKTLIVLVAMLALAGCSNGTSTSAPSTTRRVTTTTQYIDCPPYCGTTSTTTTAPAEQGSATLTYIDPGGDEVQAVYSIGAPTPYARAQSLGGSSLKSDLAACGADDRSVVVPITLELKVVSSQDLNNVELISTPQSSALYDSSSGNKCALSAATGGPSSDGFYRLSWQNLTSNSPGSEHYWLIYPNVVTPNSPDGQIGTRTLTPGGLTFGPDANRVQMKLTNGTGSSVTPCGQYAIADWCISLSR